MKRLFAMLKARLLELVRDRSTLAWNLLFAPLVIVGIAAVFSGEPQPLMNVGLLADTAAANTPLPFLKTPAIRFHPEPDAATGLARLQHHQLDFLIDPSVRPVRYWLNTESVKSRLLESLLVAQEPGAQRQSVTSATIRYSDWLVPGLLGLNIMFSSLFAIGQVIIRYRRSGYLKRLNGTPLRAIEFIGAQMLACLIVVMVAAVGVFAACKIVLNLQVAGSYWTLLAIATLGSMAMIGMSLLVSARISSEELSSGLLNLLSWPMVVLSGVFFSLDSAPQILKTLAELFPLTHLLDAARAVMLDGATLVDIAHPMLALAAMTALFLLAGTRMFRWADD